MVDDSTIMPDACPLNYLANGCVMTNRAKSELVIEFADLQTKMQKRLAGALSAHGISFTEYLVLRQLNRAVAKKMRRIDLAGKVGLSASGVTRLLNPMQKIGLVNKEENARDARVSLVALTGAGQRIFEDAETTVNHTAGAFLAPINSKERAMLSGLVRKLS
jgi:DNA-binding MarR family transcriptional regulator